MKPPRKRWPKGTWMRLKSGSLLRELMNTKHLSNADVALHARCSRTWISALVNERRTSCSTAVAERIAERLEVPVTLLFDPRSSAGSGQNNKQREKVPA